MHFHFINVFTNTYDIEIYIVLLVMFMNTLILIHFMLNFDRGLIDIIFFISGMYPLHLSHFLPGKSKIQSIFSHPV